MHSLIKMIPIRALNEDYEESCSSIETEPKVTGEAEETIIVSEYLRALNLQNAKHTDDALLLFLELLETEMLSKASNNSKDNKIFIVKYNCYRNIGLIYEEKSENGKALEYLIEAVELDDTDAYTIYCLAKLALKIGQIHLARMYYERCFELNPEYWPSLDGLLQVYCSSENIIELFHWAAQCFWKDKLYKRANNVLIEIRNQFMLSLPFLEGILTFPVRQFHTFTLCNKSFPNGGLLDEFDEPERSRIMEYESFELQTINWVELGRIILQLCESIVNSSQTLLRILKLDYIKPQTTSSRPECYRENASSSMQNQIIEQCDFNKQKTTDIVAEAETKNRRRGSELKILEQWGWHKSRRSSRKKSFEAVDPIESTADRFLRRTLSKYFLQVFDESLSPFSEEVYENKDDISNHTIHIPECSINDFYDVSKHGLEALISELQKCEFDSYGLHYLYLQHLSFYWDECIPQEIRNIYLDLFNSFKKYNFIQYWNQLSLSEISALFRISLFFLELEFNRIKEEPNNDGESELSFEFHHLLNNLQLFGTYLPDTEYFSYQCRYLWLSCMVSLFENDLYSAVNKLEQIEKLIGEESKSITSEIISNQHLKNMYNSDYIHSSIISLRRRICLGSVNDMYNVHNYPELVLVLKESLISVKETQYNDNSIPNIPTQIELLLECLWNMGQYSDCMKWAEKGLKYTTDIFSSHLNDTNKKKWAKTINFILDYVILIIKKGIIDILQFENLPRMVQTMHKILTVQLDPLDKHQSHHYTIECWKVWTVLYYILERQDDENITSRKTWIMNNESIVGAEDETMLNSVMMFFIAHELLGRRQWCSKDNSEILFMMLDVIVPKLRSPLFETYRDIINECLEQTTYCLYGYPTRKGKMRHIQDHEATPCQLTWERAIQLFDIYRPDILPEFNSYKIDSISADMEALLQQILLTMPENYDVAQYTATIIDFMNGDQKVISWGCRKHLLPFSIRSIYYLLADYYFKCRDFTKAINYYVMDLVIEPLRFDSWAGISLSKASKCETMLNSTEMLRHDDFLGETKNAIRCFEQCIALNDYDLQLCVEYGSFAYNVHSYCSRALKSQNASVSSVETQRQYYLKIAFESFMKVNIGTNIGDLKEEYSGYREAEVHEDEKWLYHYMLGKIAEKKKVHPIVYLTHYLKAAKYLYDCNATYPIKINHSNPSHLSIEALELFYRTNAAIIKYLEKNLPVCKQIARLFKEILKELTMCPFAVNRAKINENNFKHKLTEQNNYKVLGKHTKFNNISISPGRETKENDKTRGISYYKSDKETVTSIIFDSFMEINDENPRTDLKFSFRRISQEDTQVSNITTKNISIGTSSASSESDSPNSAPDFSSDSETESTTDDEGPLSSVVRDLIFKDCIKNLEECITRFPEHYKSVYRLAYHYLHAPGSTKSFEHCHELLLGAYKTALGNQINGLFTEKKNNNLFNGIWRIPSPDIDRPGSFASHLSKCVIILIDILKLFDDHETLIDLAIQLYRTPDTDKKYLNESDREKLFEDTVSSCIAVYENLLEKHTKNREDTEILTLLVGIFKAYRKTIKHMQNKETIFSSILVYAYKIYVQEKAELPINANILDLAIKLCTYEINYRKTTEKNNSMIKCNPGTLDATTTLVTPMQPISTGFIPGLTRFRKVNVVKHQSATAEIANLSPFSKYVPTGHSTVVSYSLPGLTITPVNIPNAIETENISTSSSICHASSSTFLINKSNLSGDFRSPMLMNEFSESYLDTFANLNTNNVNVEDKKRQRTSTNELGTDGSQKSVVEITNESVNVEGIDQK